ncbi:PE family protein [Mycobacterium angelicum]|uniref:PE family protein n=1 Tax=Mycobacterium angelicum TaxID=470074 RepID=A0A1W9ZC22_MYCAN|nr:PE family protein [Mycobacterium angelicum]MCV7196104.1 PE family protein [Mycobacterium angelicum]ORA11318.1 PE family protein [Mycobacterium angelicum]
MPFVSTQPEIMTEAAAGLRAIGSAMRTQNAATAPPTTELPPAAADEVSAVTAAQFAAHAAMFQAVAAQAKAIHETFVAMLAAGADAYLAAEDANAAVMS